MLAVDSREKGLCLLDDFFTFVFFLFLVFFVSFRFCFLLCLFFTSRLFLFFVLFLFLFLLFLDGVSMTLITSGDKPNLYWGSQVPKLPVQLLPFVQASPPSRHGLYFPLTLAWPGTL